MAPLLILESFSLFLKSLKMKKTFFLILFLSLSLNNFSNNCNCDTPKLALEFLGSKHVFLGTVIEKIYSKDESSFKIVFKIIEHFKEGENPKTLEFKFQNSKEISSCDWEINLNDRWLVFTKNINGKLSFHGICSNSRRILNNGYPTTIKNISENWDHFNIDKFIFSSLDGRFENSIPNINLDTLVNKYSKKNYGKEYGENIAYIVVDIDRKENIIQTSMNYPSKKNIKTFKYDPIFQLLLYYPLRELKTKTAFEIDIYNEIKKIKNWTPVLIENTNIAVSYRKYLQFQKKMTHYISIINTNNKSKYLQQKSHSIERLFYYTNFLAFFTFCFVSASSITSLISET